LPAYPTAHLAALRLAPSPRLATAPTPPPPAPAEPDRFGGAVLEEEPVKVKPPAMYKVMLLNDDYTPMEFVVATIQKFFGKSREQATQIMLKVHRDGMGVCGIYAKDVAATKVELVLAHAREHQHPLQCLMEEN
jgi:ATP-dependent Clp protease adaptor protein ClpS